MLNCYPFIIVIVVGLEQSKHRKV